MQASDESSSDTTEKRTAPEHCEDETNANCGEGRGSVLEEIMEEIMEDEDECMVDAEQVC